MVALEQHAWHDACGQHTCTALRHTLWLRACRADTPTTTYLPPNQPTNQVPVRIIYMTAQQGDVPPTDILPEGLSAEQQTAAAREPKVHMLYRPGHYDILMPRAAQ